MNGNFKFPKFLDKTYLIRPFSPIKEKVRIALVKMTYSKLKVLCQDLHLNGYSKYKSKGKLVDFILNTASTKMLGKKLFPSFFIRNLRLLSLVAGIIGIIVTVHNTNVTIQSSNHHSKSHENSLVGQEQFRRFESSDSNLLKVLIVSLKADKDFLNFEIDYKGAILERRKRLKDEMNLPIKFLTQTSINSDCPMTDKEAASLGKAANADIVLWGNFEENTFGVEKVRLRYSIVDPTLVDSGKLSGDSKVQPLENISQLKNGYLQKDSDYVINWMLGFMAFEKGDYKTTRIHLSSLLTELDTFQDLGTYLRVMYMYTAVGEYSKALIYGNKALDILSVSENGTAIELSIVLDYLGLTYLLMDDYEPAFEFIRMALLIRDREFDSNKELVAQSYEHLALIDFKKGDYQKALELQLKGLSILEPMEYPSNEYTIPSYNNLGLVYKALGKNEEAIMAMQKVIALMEASRYSNHASLGTAYNNLALVYRKMGNLERAKSLLILARNIQKKASGNFSINMVRVHSNLGKLLLEMDDLDSAKYYLNEALGGVNMNSEVSPSLVAHVYNNISQLSLKTDNFNLALEYQLKCIQIKEEINGADSHLLSKNYLTLNQIYEALGTEVQKQISLNYEVVR